MGLRLHPDSLADRLRAETTLGRAARRAIDLVQLAEAPPLLRFAIASDGQLLQEPGAWTEFKARAMVDWWDFAPTARMIHAAAIRRLREEGDDGQAWRGGAQDRRLLHLLRRQASQEVQTAHSRGQSQKPRGILC